MNPIFKNRTDLKKEYQILHKNILPMLKKCGHFNIFKCHHCLKFSANCNLCIKKRHTNCNEFNKSKDILLNYSDFQIKSFVRNFLLDYFNVNDLTKEFFKMYISEEVQKKKKIPYTFIVEKYKKYCIRNNHSLMKKFSMILKDINAATI